MLFGKRGNVQILKEHGFVQDLSNPSLFVHMKRDVRLLVHGDDFMVAMPSHEEKWFASVLFPKYDGKCTGEFHSDGNIAMESFVFAPCDLVGSRIWQG